MKSITLALVAALALTSFGCNHSTEPKTAQPPSFIANDTTTNDTPAHAIERLINSYEKKNESAFAGMLTGDYRYEFSNSTDPNLVTRYSSGWFKSDETASSTHLFSGYTPPGGATRSAASTISIALTTGTPTDDNSSGVDPATHKILATRIDGQIVVPQAGSEPITYPIENNFNVFYLVRGDVAAGLDSNQPSNADHWYVYRWVDLTGTARPSLVTQAIQFSTWGAIKGMYR